MNALQATQDFVKQDNGNISINNTVIQLYMRVQNKWIDGELQKCVVIANICIAEHMRGKGVFGNLIKTIQKATKHQYIYVECIGNPRFAEKLKREGWNKDLNMEYDINYYIKVS